MVLYSICFMCLCLYLNDILINFVHLQFITYLFCVRSIILLLIYYSFSFRSSYSIWKDLYALICNIFYKYYICMTTENLGIYSSDVNNYFTNVILLCSPKYNYVPRYCVYFTPGRPKEERT